ncbi:hypothetical protein BGX34_001416 [Mortierella sp. NVP85]|nr:hypothetical protein BGX34_001416 [Mortierella sp. NVP85]
MARLLCVNKAICAAALPSLYGDCFNTITSRCQSDSKKTPANSTLQLVCTLLRQVLPQDEIPGLLRAAILAQDDRDEQDGTQMAEETSTPVFKYGLFVRKIVLEHYLTSSMFDIHHNSRAMEYAATQQLFDKYIAERLILDTRDSHRDDAFISALEIDVHRKLIWTLCQDHLGTIEELSIPLTDIGRYIDYVDQFTSLSKVIFTVEKSMWAPESLYPNPVQEIQDERQRELEAERDRLFRAMIQFVQQHTHIHKHVLRQVILPNSYQLPGTSRKSTVDVWFEVQALLPPLQNPRLINHLNWRELVARLPDTNLSHVESIMLTYFGEEASTERTFALLNNQPLFLTRCRALKHLEITTFGPDMFRWAVMEKEQRDKEYRQESIVGRHLNPWHAHQISLVPLRSVKLTHKTPSGRVQELDDLTVAFSDSLEELTACEDWDTWRPVLTDLSTAPKVVHGQGWVLPRLRVLIFEVIYSQLHFDMDALQRFRALESLCLADRIMIYNHGHIRSWPSVNLPHLKNLVLAGSPALFFNMDSLHHLPSLEYLRLRMSESYNCFFIPSPEDMAREELDTQDSQAAITDGHGSLGMLGSSQGYQAVGEKPRLTWDWYLPNLRILDLLAVFAFKFEFQWLQQLPSLQSLYLNTKSSRGRLHERRITLKDLSRGLYQQQDEDERQCLSDRYFSSPKLELIHLEGHWVIDAKVLEVLFSVVMPHMRGICFGADCAGFTLREWIMLARKSVHLETSCLDRKFKHDEIKELGLMASIGPQEDHNSRKLVQHSLCGEQFWDAMDQ